MDRLHKIQEIITLLVFVLGMFKSTPEGRKRLEGIRLQKDIKDWRKERYKFIKDLRKQRDKNEINETELTQLLAEWDEHNPMPDQ